MTSVGSDATALQRNTSDVGLGILFKLHIFKFVIFQGQLGLAMSGMAIGFLAGPPIGGALYSRFGFRGPFICGIIVSLVDLIGRLLIIERKDALRWNIDPAAVVPSVDRDEEKSAEGPVNPAPPTQQSDHTIVRLSLVGVIARLFRSSRAVVVITVTFLYGYRVHFNQRMHITERSAESSIVPRSLPCPYIYRISGV
jgi:MFS family permease